MNVRDRVEFIGSPGKTGVIKAIRGQACVVSTSGGNVLAPFSMLCVAEEYKAPEAPAPAQAEAPSQPAQTDTASSEAQEAQADSTQPNPETVTVTVTVTDAQEEVAQQPRQVSTSDSYVRIDGALYVRVHGVYVRALVLSEPDATGTFKVGLMCDEDDMQQVASLRRGDEFTLRVRV